MDDARALVRAIFVCELYKSQGGNRRITLVGRVFAWKRARAQRCSERPGVKEIGLDVCLAKLRGIASHHGFQSCLTGAIGSPIGFWPDRGLAGDEYGPAGLGLTEQRIKAADEAVVGGCVYCEDLLPEIRLYMADW